MSSTTSALSDDISVAALHASSIRAMTSFVAQPSAEVAQTVVMLLSALSRHPDRFKTPCGHDVYANANAIWQRLAEHLHACHQRRETQALH